MPHTRSISNTKCLASPPTSFPITVESPTPMCTCTTLRTGGMTGVTGWMVTELPPDLLAKDNLNRQAGACDAAVFGYSSSDTGSSTFWSHILSSPTCESPS